MARLNAEDSMFVGGFVAIVFVAGAWIIRANAPKEFSPSVDALFGVLIGIGALSLLAGVAGTVALKRLEDG